MQSRSSWVKPMVSVVKNPLRMLRCDRVAPLGSPVVPEVYWMLIASPLSRVDIPLAGTRRHGVAPGQEVVPVRGAEEHHPLQRPAVVAHLVHHRAVVAGLELGRGDEQPQAGLVQRVGELVGAVGGVDVDQDRPDLRGGVRDRPLGAVRGPDAHPVALRDAGAEQAAGERVHVAVELGVGPAAAGGDLHQRLATGVLARDPRELAPIVSSVRAGVVPCPAYDSMTGRLVVQDTSQYPARGIAGRIRRPTVGRVERRRGRARRGRPRPGGGAGHCASRSPARSIAVALARPGVLDVVDAVRRGEGEHQGAVVPAHLDRRLVVPEADVVPPVELEVEPAEDDLLQAGRRGPGPGT